MVIQCTSGVARHRQRPTGVDQRFVALASAGAENSTRARSLLFILSRYCVDNLADCRGPPELAIHFAGPPDVGRPAREAMGQIGGVIRCASRRRMTYVCDTRILDTAPTCVIREAAGNFHMMPLVKAAIGFFVPCRLGPDASSSDRLLTVFSPPVRRRP